MALPARIERSVKQLLDDLVALRDRIDTEPDAYPLRDPLKRLEVELRRSLTTAVHQQELKFEEPRKPQKATTKPKKEKGKAKAKTKKTKTKIKPAPAPRTPVEPPSEWDPPPTNPTSRWRRLLIRRMSSNSPPRAMLIFEELDEFKEPDNRDVRAWGQELLNDAPWSYIPDAFLEEGWLQLEFPPNLYHHMPMRLALTMLRGPREGATLRMVNERGNPFSTFTIIEVGNVTGARVATEEQQLLR